MVEREEGFTISAVSRGSSGSVVSLWRFLVYPRSLIMVADAFTHLGISSGNEWGIKASLFSSKDLLGVVKPE